jgi:hypothetical protein
MPMAFIPLPLILACAVPWILILWGAYVLL